MRGVSSSDGPFDDGLAETIGCLLAILAAEVEEVPPLLNGIGKRYAVDDTWPWGSGDEECRIARLADDDAGVGAALGGDEAGVGEVEGSVRVVHGERRVPQGTRRSGARSAENATSTSISCARATMRVADGRVRHPQGHLGRSRQRASMAGFGVGDEGLWGVREWRASLAVGRAMMLADVAPAG